METYERFRALVKPNDSALRILGKSGMHMSRALERWAALMAQHIRINEEMFTPDEWRALVESCDTLTFDAFPNPEPQIKNGITQAVKFARLVERFNLETLRGVTNLERKLLECAALRAWAIVEVIYFTTRFRKQIDKEKDKFWTLDFITELNRRELDEVGKGEAAKQSLKIPNRKKRSAHAS